MDMFINIGMILTYVLLFVAVLALVVFPIFQMVTNFAKAKNGLIALALLLGVFFLAFLISPADQGPIYEKFEIGPTTSKLIGAGLVTTYLILASIFIAAIYNEVAKWFK